LLTESGELEYDPAVVAATDLVKEIVELGYQCSLTSDTPKKIKAASASSSTCVLSIRGMSCGSCSSAIERNMSAKVGIHASAVNFLTESGEFQYDRSIISAADIVKAVSGLGYQATLASDSVAVSSSTCSIGIRGMSCASCVGGIERALKAVSGISKININLLMESGDFEFDSRTDAGTIVKMINGLGYQATLNSSSSDSEDSTDSIESAELLISGMTCSSCVAGIEKHVSALPGVVSISVNLLSQSAQVKFHSSVTAVRDICDAVTAFGYATTVPAASASLSSSAEAFAARQLQTEASWKRRLLFSAFFSIPLFVIAMAIPQKTFIFTTYVVGAMPISSLVMLILCTPVQVIFFFFCYIHSPVLTLRCFSLAWVLVSTAKRGSR
jgi:Cu+-exporting ATPase